MPSFTERKAQLEAARAEWERRALEEFEAEEREIRELEEEERRIEEERARREQQRAEEERKKTEEAERRRRAEESQKGTGEAEMVMGDTAACWNCRSRGAECVRQSYVVIFSLNLLFIDGFAVQPRRASGVPTGRNGATRRRRGRGNGGRE